MDALLINMDILGRIYSLCPLFWPLSAIFVAFIFISVMLSMEDTIILVVKFVRWFSFEGCIEVKLYKVPMCFEGSFRDI